MFVRIGTFDVPPQNIGAVVEHFRTEAVRAFSGYRGFLGYQSFVDRDLGRMVGISRWTSRAELEASAEAARNILAGAKELGASVVGEPQILEEAFDAAPVASDAT
jgi:quinol monooxygenase YgiN